MNASQLLDEFRPFRRGEIALARRAMADPAFLAPRDLQLLRYAIRLAQLSTIGSEQDDLVDRIGSSRLRMLQLLAPALPTDPEAIDPAALVARLPKIADLVGRMRRSIVETQLASEEKIDRVLADKRVALVLGGAAGSGYVFLGALQQLENQGVRPSYLVGCSVGSVLAVIRARNERFDLTQLFGEVQQMRERGLFRRPSANPRFGVPSALRIDLRHALGDLFSHPDGSLLKFGELPIPTDTLATGLHPGALADSGESFAKLVDSDLHDSADLSQLSGGVLGRAVSALVSLAMSRRALVPVFMGSDSGTARLPALDGAGFSAAIPGFLCYDVPPEDVSAGEILQGLCDEHGLMGLVDGALSSVVPARYTWESIEAGRLGTRHCLILALDAIANPSGTNALLGPLLRVISATAHRDSAFWDLCVHFHHAPPFLDLFPSEDRLRAAATSGERQFASTASLLRELLAPLPAWTELHTEDR